jgi:hypothetical protein
LGWRRPELTVDFQSLPDEYQQVIRLAQDTYNITVAPLQLLAVVLNHPASEQSSFSRPEQLRDEAEKLRSQIETQLEPSRYQVAWESGQRQRLLDVVTEILK